MQFALICLLFGVVTVNGQCSNVKEAFWQSEIVPDVIDSPPNCFLKVVFPFSWDTLTPGKCLKPTQVEKEPLVTWKADRGALYTLVMTDPDVPSRMDPYLGHVRHWWVVNIEGGNSRNGQTVFQWLGSAPDKKSGCHRYVFLLFKQPSRIQINTFVGVDTTTDQNLRVMTSIRELQEKYGLKLECGNFYRAGYDDTSPRIREQVGIPLMDLDYNLGNCTCINCWG